MMTELIDKPKPKSNRKPYGARKNSSGSLLPPKKKKKIQSVNQVLNGNQYNGKIDISKALKLRMANGLSYAEIGKIFGVTAGAICARLQSHIALLEDPEISQAYTENKEKIMAGAESRFLVEALRPEKLNAASSLQCVTAVGILYDKQRLERGLSTDNISIRSLTQDIGNKLKELDEKRANLINDIHSME